MPEISPEQMLVKILNSKIAPGDIFYVPAINRDGTYGFVLARYIELIPVNVGHLIKVFDDFYTAPPISIEEVNTSRRLFRPIMCSLSFAEVPRWKILFSDPGYGRSMSDYKNIEICFYHEIWKGGKTRAAQQSEMIGLQDSTCWRMHHIIFRVNAHLAGYFRSNESYDYHRLPPEEPADSESAMARVMDLARVIDAQSKEWAKSKSPRRKLK